MTATIQKLVKETKIKVAYMQEKLNWNTAAICITVIGSPPQIF